MVRWYALLGPLVMAVVVVLLVTAAPTVTLGAGQHGAHGARGQHDPPPCVGQAHKLPECQTPSATAAPSATPLPTSTSTLTPTNAPTLTSTSTVTSTATVTEKATVTLTAVPTLTATATALPVASPTSPPSATPTATVAPTISATSTPAATPTLAPPTATPSATPSATAIPTVTPLPTATATATMTATLPPTLTATSTAAATATTAAGDCTVNSSELPPSQEEQNLLNTINRYRTVPYTWSDTLSRAAVWQAHDMADHNYVGDVDTLGRDVRQRTTDCGYDPAAPVGEDVTAGMTLLFGDLSTLSAWMFDPAQWDRIVNPQYTVAGIAQAYGPFSTDKYYWVLVVGSDPATGGGGGISAQDAATPTPTPLPATRTSGPTPTATQPPPATVVGPSYDYTQQRYALVDDINATRAEQNDPAIQPLTIDARTMRVAQWKAADMNARHYTDHLIPAGACYTNTQGVQTCWDHDIYVWDVLGAEGIGGGVGENVWLGPPLGDEEAAWCSYVFWVHEGHHENMIDPNWHFVGTGMSYYTWTQGVNCVEVFSQFPN